MAKDDLKLDREAVTLKRLIHKQSHCEPYTLRGKEELKEEMLRR